MVYNEFNAVIFPRDGQSRNGLLPRMGGNRAAGPARFRIIAVMAIIAGTLQFAALGQPPDPFLAQGAPLPTVIPYPPAVFGVNTQILDQNAFAQGTDVPQPLEGTPQVARGGDYQRYQGPPAAPPSAETPPPQPKEKKEGEKSEKAEGEKRRGQGEERAKRTTPRPQSFELPRPSHRGGPGRSRLSGQVFRSQQPEPRGERQETLAADLFAGVRLWHGAEMHADALMWQGFGLSNTFGIEALSQRRRLQSRHRDSRLHVRALVHSSNLRLGRRTGGRARRPAHAWRANRTFRG